MKQLFYIFITIFSVQIYGQNDNNFFTALKNNNIDILETYLEDNIDFCLFEDQQILGKKIAMKKLNIFLNNHKILSVDVIHKGTSKDKTSQYKVAKLTTSKETFRVFVFAAGEIGAKSVKEIRIDKF